MCVGRKGRAPDAAVWCVLGQEAIVGGRSEKERSMQLRLPMTFGHILDCSESPFSFIYDFVVFDGVDAKQDGIRHFSDQVGHSRH